MDADKYLEIAERCVARCEWMAKQYETRLEKRMTDQQKVDCIRNMERLTGQVERMMKAANRIRVESGKSLKSFAPETRRLFKPGAVIAPTHGTRTPSTMVDAPP